MCAVAAIGECEARRAWRVKVVLKVPNDGATQVCPRESMQFAIASLGSSSSLQSEIVDLDLDAPTDARCVAPGLDSDSLRAVRNALDLVTCTANASNPFQHGSLFEFRHRLAGFGSSLNVFLHRGLGQLHRNRSFDGDHFLLRSSPTLDYGSGINTTRCFNQAMPCLFAHATAGCERLHAHHQHHQELRIKHAFELLRNAHPYAVVSSAAARFFAPNEWLMPQVEAVERAVGYADIAVHIRRGDKLKLSDRAAANVTDVTRRAHNTGDVIKLMDTASIARLVAHASERHNLSSVLVISDDATAPASLARELPSHLRVASLMQGKLAREWSGEISIRSGGLEEDSAATNLITHRVDGMEVGAFVFAAIWTLARARVVVANSGSNLGNLIMTLAGARTVFPYTPILVDLDGAVSTRDLFHGRYLCNLAPDHGTPARYGTCDGTGRRGVRPHNHTEATRCAISNFVVA